MKTKIPFEFVFDELSEFDFYTKPLFSTTAIYSGEKILLALREKDDHFVDNGIWIATTAEHHASLRKQLPSVRSIQLFGPGETGWQILPSSSDTFEAEAVLLCRLVIQGDERIGKIPKRKKKKSIETTKNPKAPKTKMKKKKSK